MGTRALFGPWVLSKKSRYVTILIASRKEATVAMSIGTRPVNHTDGHRSDKEQKQSIEARLREGLSGGTK